jgi:cyclase
VIPCLDVKDGKVVKGINFECLVEVGDPVVLAEDYYRQGADEIAFLDISASQESRSTMLPVIEKTAQSVFVPLLVGGGIGSVEVARDVLRAGADKISVNTAAVAHPWIIGELAGAFGCQCIVVAIDATRKGAGWKVRTHGGTRDTGLDAVKWAQEAVRLGAGEILLTSMDRDGTGSGYDLDLLRAITSAVTVPVIASGGLGTVRDAARAVEEGGASAVLAASIFHYGAETVFSFKDQLRRMGVALR